MDTRDVSKACGQEPAEPGGVDQDSVLDKKFYSEVDTDNLTEGRKGVDVAYPVRNAAEVLGASSIKLQVSGGGAVPPPPPAATHLRASGVTKLEFGTSVSPALTPAPPLATGHAQHAAPSTASVAPASAAAAFDPFAFPVQPSQPSQTVPPSHAASPAHAQPHAAHAPAHPSHATWGSFTSGPPPALSTHTAAPGSTLTAAESDGWSAFEEAPAFPQPASTSTATTSHVSAFGDPPAFPVASATTQQQRSSSSSAVAQPAFSAAPRAAQTTSVPQEEWSAFEDATPAWTAAPATSTASASAAFHSVPAASAAPHITPAAVPTHRSTPAGPAAPAPKPEPASKPPPLSSARAELPSDLFSNLGPAPAPQHMHYRAAAPSGVGHSMPGMMQPGQAYAPSMQMGGMPLQQASMGMPSGMPYGGVRPPQGYGPPAGMGMPGPAGVYGGHGAMPAATPMGYGMPSTMPAAAQPQAFAGLQMAGFGGPAAPMMGAPMGSPTQFGGFVQAQPAPQAAFARASQEDFGAFTSFASDIRQAMPPSHARPAANGNPFA
eukprot:CAMPEP_0202911888 /NCGR_PEP_ID=MMETSP1392-20130828/56199_1 /ASSEMBLY_ACC=CAM_ASM_000868 /TAXON_ID=225041 /ORGANISM="Chlamydomonas chlamydogama, Strain SAG 11-48b" /LENGTH=547 /DNA_ID=CAMNT_0049602583 /DNA_START=290 /DNA_END=1937 /DNA_ORIENTATION=+